MLALQRTVRRCYSRRQERAQLNSPLLPVGEQVHSLQQCDDSAPAVEGKIGWGELFKEELSGIMRNRYVLLPCYSGQTSRVSFRHFGGLLYNLPFLMLPVLYYPPVHCISPSLCIKLLCAKGDSQNVLQNHLSV